MADLSPNAISVPASPQAPVVPATGTPAYYQTDFSEYSTGSPPSDFTERWNSAWGSTDVQSGGDYGGKVLYLYLAGNYEWTNEWNEVPDPQEVDVLIRGRLNTNVDNAPWIVVRGSGAVNAENGYEAAFRLASDQVRIYKLSGGTVSILSSASKTLNTSTWYWMRFRAYGKTLKVKAWSGNPDDEPSTWDIEIEDTSFLGTGFCGVGAHVGTGLNNCYCDYYSVATYGGTARWPPLYMGALTSPGTVNTPKVKFKYTVQPGAISQGIAVSNAVLLTGDHLALEDLVGVAGHGLRVALAPEAASRVETARAVIDAAIAEGRVIYGVTTGFGRFADVVIPREKLLELQLNLVRSHAAGVGDPLPEETVRALVLLRANCLAKGFPGSAWQRSSCSSAS